MIRAIFFCVAFTTVLTSDTTVPTSNNTGTDGSDSVAKREVLEFYPDWVPFKNKHGDELGEFADVVKPKAKIKKRLALPMNFLIRAISDDSADYNGQGESDGDDYFDKKDWSDLNRPIYNVSVPIKPKENISDIDGVINIITKPRPDLAEDIKKSISKQMTANQDEYEDDTPDEKVNITALADEVYTTTLEPELKVILTPKTNIAVYNDYEDDSEPASKNSQLSQEEQKENEEKKKMILDSVDQLKLRHEHEQRAISEKNKQDEYDNELRHRNMKIKKNRALKRQRGKPTPPNYDEYEDMSWKDKYNINFEKKTSDEAESTEGSYLVTMNPKRETTSTTKKYVESERSKYSVFRNPGLYTIDERDDEDLELKKPPNAPRRFSSKYSSAPANTVNSAENLINPPPVATTTERVEPILYFPKIKPKKKLKKTKTTTTAPDSYVAETVEDKLTNKHTTQPISYPDTTAVSMETTEDYKTTAIDNDYPTSTASLWKDDQHPATKKTKKDLNIVRDKDGNIYHDTSAPEELTTAADSTGTGPSGEAETSNSDTVTDAVPASSDHAKEEPKEYHEEKGGGHEHHSEHEEEHEEHGKKAYEGLHKNSKTKKGHHDKEDHLGKYEDHGGYDKSHHDESGHHGEHHHEEHGKKHAKYEESGKHSKGHSTKGSHDIHKKEEYEKKVEFFEEEGDSGEEEKHGGYHNEKEHKAGGLYKKRDHHNDHHERKKGESGNFLKGAYHDVKKGHKLSGGHDSHGKHGAEHHGAGGHRSGKKWVYHHGYPAKNANLVVIDRRTDAYMHGPNYYG